MDYMEHLENLRNEIVFDESLIMTGYQRLSAINDKALFLAWIDPLVHIASGTPTGNHALNALAKKTKNLDFYNDLHRQNKLQYPFLKFDPVTKQIFSHEGRSRMLACAREGHKAVPVFIKSTYRVKNKSDLKFPLRLYMEHHTDGIIEFNNDDVMEIYDEKIWKNI